MKKVAIILSAFALIASSCGQTAKKQQSTESVQDKTATAMPSQSDAEQAHNNEDDKLKKPEDFVPKEYEIIEKVVGDLNGDGKKDVVFITRKKDFEQGYSSVDGLFIVFQKSKSYELEMAKPRTILCDMNCGCDLSAKIKNGKLYLYPNFGRYGGWVLTFRYKNSRFELIGFDSEERTAGALEKEISINFLTKKMQTKLYDWEDDEPVLREEFWQDIVVPKIANLADMLDFYRHGISEYYSVKE